MKGRLAEPLSEAASIVEEMEEGGEKSGEETFKPGDKVRLKEEFRRHAGHYGDTPDGLRGLCGVHGNDVLEIEKIADCGGKAYFKHEANPWCPVFWLEKVEILDADGVEIRVGDTVYSPMHENVRCTVTGIDFETDGFFVYVENEIGHRFRLIADDLTHTQPDTWERLEEDARKLTIDYWGCRGLTCDQCPADFPRDRNNAESCSTAMKIDIIRRAKAIAYRERCER